MRKRRAPGWMLAYLVGEIQGRGSTSMRVCGVTGMGWDGLG